MDVISILKADHEEVDALFSQIETTSKRTMKSKQALFLRINAALSLHAAAEEEILYPCMQKLTELRQGSFEAHEEHRLVKQLLAELSSFEGGSEVWDAKVTVLIDLVRHHVKEEESEYFKVLKRELDKEELRQLGEAVESFKASHKPRRSMPATRERAASAAASAR